MPDSSRNSLGWILSLRLAGEGLRHQGLYWKLIKTSSGVRARRPKPIMDTKSPKTPLEGSDAKSLASSSRASDPPFEQACWPWGTPSAPWEHQRSKHAAAEVSFETSSQKPGIHS